MANSFFQFREFIIRQDKCAMKVTTDACLFGAIVAGEIAGQKHETLKALDIGTGTGLLALMVAQQNNGIHIEAIEIDKEAATQARQNITLSPWNNRIKVINGDVASINLRQEYDLVFSNPPFYEKEIVSRDPKKNIAHHHAGMNLQTLLSLISRLLRNEGHFWLLLPFKREREVRELLSRKNLFIVSILFIRPTPDHDYFRMILHGSVKSDQNVPVRFEDISIKDAADQYTPEFISLLRDYYLYL